MSYPDSYGNSRALYETAKNVMPGGNTRTTVYINPFPIYAERGLGCKLWDVDGNEYYDCINNFTSMIHGYGHPETIKAVLEQIQLGTCFGAPTKIEVDLAELLVSRLPSVEEIRFTNSGTESVMMAIKAARAYTKRSKIIKIEGSYHGSYDFAEVSLDSSPSNWGGTPASTPYSVGTPTGVLDDVIVVPFNQIEPLRDALNKYGMQVAAVLIDPMPNRVGLIPADKQYLQELIDITHAAGSLVIFDEVISFRLGFNGAQGLWGLNPDLTSLGKIIGGGFPVGAVGGRKEIMAVFDPSNGKPALPHGGTFTANPITMTAGLAAMTALTDSAFVSLNGFGDLMRTEITAMLHKYGLPGHCVGLGSLFKIHFTDKKIIDYRSVYPSKHEKEMLGHLHLGLINRGVFAAGYGLFALSTPMTEVDIKNILQAIDLTLEDISKKF